MILPRVVLHIAVSLDGRTTGFEPDAELFYRLATTWQEDATLAGVDTLLAGCLGVPDDGPHKRVGPTLVPHDRRPVLVVPDSRGRLRKWEHLLAAPYWRGGVALCCRATPKAHLDYLRDKSIDVIHAGDARVDLRAALALLGSRHGVRILRADSGGSLNSALMSAGLVDEISLVIHPVMSGGSRAGIWVDPAAADAKHGCLPLELISFETLKDEIVWLRYKVPR